MDKWNLIHTALKELIKQWNSGENRDYFETSIDYSDRIGGRPEFIIRWEPKVSADGQNHMSIPKAVKISRRKDGQFTCTIIDTATPVHSRKDKIVQEKYRLYWFTKLNRDFENLKTNIERYKRLKENSLFLNDLVKVFPRTLDGALLGDDYDE